MGSFRPDHVLWRGHKEVLAGSEWPRGLGPLRSLASSVESHSLLENPPPPLLRRDLTSGLGRFLVLSVDGLAIDDLPSFSSSSHSLTSYSSKGSAEA